MTLTLNSKKYNYAYDKGILTLTNIADATDIIPITIDFEFLLTMTKSFIIKSEKTRKALDIPLNYNQRFN